MNFSEQITRDQHKSISWINNLRLIAMFAVVVLHTASPLLFNYKTTPLQNWLAADVYNALTRFAVPVFVMITGALLLSREYALTDFLKKRLGRLILPFIFWSLVYVAYRLYNEEIFFTNDTWANTKMVLHQLQTGSYYHLWYVYTLIGLYLVIPVISKFVNNATETELLYFLAIWMLTTLLGKPYFTRFATAIDLHNFTGYIGYLVLGYYLAYKQFHFKDIAFKALFIYLAFVLLIAVGTYYFALKSPELSTFYYEPIGPFIIALSTSAFLTARFTVVKAAKVIGWISDKAGRFTFGIYLCHALVLTLLDLAGVNYTLFSPVLSIPFIALLCFVLSWFLIYMLSKIPFIKYLTV